jgi:hypothetical protein
VILAHRPISGSPNRRNLQRTGAAVRPRHIRAPHSQGAHRVSNRPNKSGGGPASRDHCRQPRPTPGSARASDRPATDPLCSAALSSQLPARLCRSRRPRYAYTRPRRVRGAAPRPMALVGMALDRPLTARQQARLPPSIFTTPSSARSSSTPRGARSTSLRPTRAASPVAKEHAPRHGRRTSATVRRTPTWAHPAT